MNKFIKLLFLFVGFLLLGWAVSTVNLKMVLNLLIQLGYGLIIILIIYGIVTWVDTIAWKKCFKLEEAQHFHIWDLWCIRAIGEAYNTITPLGTLGGGNHFIEINRSDTGCEYITVHSGSRNLGQKICRFHQDIITKGRDLDWDLYDK